MDHHSKTGTAEIRDSAEENSKCWGHRTDLECSKRGTAGSTSRNLEVSILEIKKKNTTTKCTDKSYYLWELHIGFRTHEGVSKASEADLQFLNADEQMELTTTMSDRQKVAAAVIMAQIKLTEHPWDEDMGKSQNDIQK